MEPFAFALILIAAITHAAWNTIAKSATGNPYTFVWAYLSVAAVILLPVTAAFLLKQGWPSDLRLIFIPIVSGALHLIYLVTLQTAYSKGDLGVVYPTARGVGPLLTMVVALAVIGERPKPIALIGALVVLAGILVVATASRGEKHWLSQATI